jgi:hypothetical protein
MEMKTGQIFAATIITLILIVFSFVVVTGENGYIPKENEEYYGIWTNPEYNDRSFSAKVLYKPDGTFYTYGEMTSDSWGSKGEYKINDKWTDAKGDIWYKVTWKKDVSTFTYYELTKLSKSGTVMESAFTINDYPDKIDSEGSKIYHRIYYRQE